MGDKNEAIFWKKAGEIFFKLFSEDSILNYPVKDLIEETFLFFKECRTKIGRTRRSMENEVSWYDKYFEKIGEMDNVHFSKTAFLLAANFTIFIWIIANETVSNPVFKNVSVYMKGALGAEESFTISENKGLISGDRDGLRIEQRCFGNSLSEIKCGEDKKESRSSNLCADAGGDINLIEEMAKEKRRLDEKEVKKEALKNKKAVRIRAPAPYVFAVKNGRMVCNRKNDHPSKSKENKKGHMDMECCLDPDEIPNPHCYYPLEKYGKYLVSKK